MIALLILTGACAAPATAQTTAVLVEDIRSGAAEDVIPFPFGSVPEHLTDVGGTLFFAANDGSTGTELWRSDGTATGTTLVADIFPVPFPLGSHPQDLIAVGSTLFFTANDGVNGRELWSSDGTAAGTALVADIHPGPGDARIADLTDVDGTLFFSADDGVTGRELWKSDGTVAGTTLVRDIQPLRDLRDGSNASLPKGLTNVGGTLFFSADDGLTGRELWSSDGTLLGTVLVKDIAPGPLHSSPQELSDVRGTLFFSANDGLTGGFELWRSDGTVLGTALVRDLSGRFAGSNPHELTDVGGTVFFSANGLPPGRGSTGFELWRSDGTAAGTTLVKEIRAGWESSFPRELTDVGGTLFFVADDTACHQPAVCEPVSGGVGSELWRSDGTAAGTTVVDDIRAGAAGSAPSDLTAAGDTLFFSADDGQTGRELWKSDGTPGATTLVKDIRAGAGGSGPEDLTGVARTIFFRADDRLVGRELWRTEETGGSLRAGETAGDHRGEPSAARR